MNDVRVRRALALSLVIGVSWKLFRLFGDRRAAPIIFPARRKQERVLAEVVGWAQFGFIDVGDFPTSDGRSRNDRPNEVDRSAVWTPSLKLERVFTKSHAC